VTPFEHGIDAYERKAVSREIYIDPSHEFFNADALFDLNNAILNRDGQLLPFHRVRAYLSTLGVNVRTADYIGNDAVRSGDRRDYYSLGILKNYARILETGAARLAAFVIMEPPVVAPELYKALPELTSVFDRVYVHNIEGDGYSLLGSEASKLRRFYWPIPHNDVLKPYWWNTGRMRRLVVINGSHNPHGREREQYSLRIDAMTELAKSGVIDLYGKGWNIWWSRRAMWMSYWRNRRVLMSIYKGACSSKFEVLAKYEFCLCFENMSMNGYITEKIFDCLYAGTIPLYLGAPDILKYLPPEIFVDCRRYTSWTEMWQDVVTMPSERLIAMRLAGREFLQSEPAEKFYQSLERIFEDS
jgi:hypothetical protein